MGPLFAGIAFVLAGWSFLGLMSNLLDLKYDISGIDWLITKFRISRMQFDIEIDGGEDDNVVVVHTWSQWKRRTKTNEIMKATSETYI